MSLSIGIVGLPNVGKSTLFSAITKKEIDRENYPFCTIDPNVGVVAVPDSRVDQLAEMNKSAKKIYTTIDFVDIAGLVKGASRGEGLGNKFLANIREVNTVVYVLRAFVDNKIINTESSIDILRDKDILDTEMSLKDLETLEKRIEGLERRVRANDKEAIKESGVLTVAKKHLENGEYLADVGFSDDEKKILNSYSLLTMKPRLFLLNGKEEDVSVEVKDVFEKKKWNYLIFDILAEFDSSGLSKAERSELGLAVDLKLDDLIKKAYDILGLITFFTSGPTETRAWTLKKGGTAPMAGAVIHTDFFKNFIKAEVVGFDDLISAGSFALAREKGLVRTEGKEYVISDGDVIEIKVGA